MTRTELHLLILSSHQKSFWNSICLELIEIIYFKNIFLRLCESLGQRLALPKTSLLFQKSSNYLYYSNPYFPQINRMIRACLRALGLQNITNPWAFQNFSKNYHNLTIFQSNFEFFQECYYLKNNQSPRALRALGLQNIINPWAFAKYTTPTLFLR